MEFNWALFWKVVRIGFGAVITLAALVMLVFSLFVGSFDIAYAMFAVLSLILGLIMLIFGVTTLPRK
ncbi:MAG: hypothetical protein E7467_08910 [Ruminococcaceae bacterium]|nr:hypothetical protein [Oscillospiraceae bacterium]